MAAEGPAAAAFALPFFAWAAPPHVAPEVAPSTTAAAASCPARRPGGCSLALAGGRRGAAGAVRAAVAWTFKPMGRDRHRGAAGRAGHRGPAPAFFIAAEAPEDSYSSPPGPPSSIPQRASSPAAESPGYSLGDNPYEASDEAVDRYGLNRTQRHQIFVDIFRQASPYVNVHRGSTFVICFGGEVVADVQAFQNLVSDIAILNSLGVHLVLVAGARPQIDERVRDLGISCDVHGCAVNEQTNIRITCEKVLRAVKDAVGTVRTDVEASLSVGLIKSPLAGADIHVASGNFVFAKPVGVRGGVDHKYAGEIRRVEVAAIRKHLHNNEIVLLTPIAYSVTGEVFNCSSEDVAWSAAQALEADKLIYITEQMPEPCTFTRSELATMLEQRGDELPAAHGRMLRRGLPRDVRRLHLVGRTQDGALLVELFTRNGSGLMVVDDLYEGMRKARLNDIVHIEALIRPLERAGVLVQRSREQLRRDIENFTVIEREDRIIGCAALFVLSEDLAEVACVAISPEFRSSGKGDLLLAYLEREAYQRGIRRLCCLSTHTSHYFVERGFEQCTDLSVLPEGRRSRIDPKRNSRLFVKHLVERGVEEGELLQSANRKKKMNSSNQPQTPW
eukprot:tig00021168_g19102.t1